ncbi:phosphotransferase [uncultured Roseovarius sp.]|uniref:phosphotransferase n=1 Tax=uncultured Roseovarius sp. TaxID=293344 RepID=UPI00260170C1|nr:phosphotransferase [uncultured Roseovarius sp.]
MSEPAAPLPDLDLLGRVDARLRALVTAHPEVAGLDISEVLRIVPEKRAVLAGRLDGRAVVARLVEPKYSEALAKEWAELQRIWPHMQTGRYCVAEPILHLPDAGLMVIERVEGDPLLEHLWQQDVGARAQHLRPVAEWLRQYTEVSESWQEGNATGWLARVERAAGTQPFARLRRIEAAILTHLRSMTRALEGADWRVAISHGDYHPNNLILGSDRLTGIDTGGSGRMPVCKDIARFLVHMGRRGMIPSGRRYLGVDAEGLEVFADVFALTEIERWLWLPFFIGVEALIRVENRTLKSSRIRRAEEMYALLLEDLAAR